MYIIGNGFDLNLNLKTSYRDFYKYFIEQSSKKELVAEMKENLDSETWADLELALGKYTAKFDSIEAFQEAYFEISDKLVEYIHLEEKKLKLSEEKKLKLCNDLIFPESYFRLEYGKLITDYCNKWDNHNWNINIINFNYSQTIERLLDFQAGKQYAIGSNQYGKKVTLGQILHIHGVAIPNETILLGVNDIFQIENKSFSENVDFLDILVKPQTNKGLRNGIDAACLQLLRNANLICIFGSSIGETDKIWWKFLGHQLKKDNCRVVYFVREKEIIPSNRQQFIPKKIRDCQNNILSKTGLDFTGQNQVRDNIFVGHNTDMFKLD